MSHVYALAHVYALHTSMHCCMVCRDQIKPCADTSDDTRRSVVWCFQHVSHHICCITVSLTGVLVTPSVALLLKLQHVIYRVYAAVFGVAGVCVPSSRLAGTVQWK